MDDKNTFVDNQATHLLEFLHWILYTENNNENFKLVFE